MRDPETDPFWLLLAELKTLGAEGSQTVDAWIWRLAEPYAFARTYWNACIGLPKEEVPFPTPAGLGRLETERYAPKYTASLDAAASLVPPGCSWECGFSRYVPHNANVKSSRQAHGGWGAEVDSNRPIAICLAALQARHSLDADADINV